MKLATGNVSTSTAVYCYLSFNLVSLVTAIIKLSSIANPVVSDDKIAYLLQATILEFYKRIFFDFKA